MADKDIGERDVLKLCLPNASDLICLFHTHFEVSNERLHVKRWGLQLERELCAWNVFRKWLIHYQMMYIQYS